MAHARAYFGDKLALRPSWRGLLLRRLRSRLLRLLGLFLLEQPDDALDEVAGLLLGLARLLHGQHPGCCAERTWSSRPARGGLEAELGILHAPADVEGEGELAICERPACKVDQEIGERGRACGD